MAYLKPTRLKCPACGFQATIKTVVGVGPGSRRGDTPSKRFHNAAPFVAETTKAGENTGRLLCPHDATPVWSDKRGYRALGPLTQKESANPLMRKWLAPGTAPAKTNAKPGARVKPKPVPKALQQTKPE